MYKKRPNKQTNTLQIIQNMLKYKRYYTYINQPLAHSPYLFI